MLIKGSRVRAVKEVLKRKIATMDKQLRDNKEPNSSTFKPHEIRQAPDMIIDTKRLVLLSSPPRSPPQPNKPPSAISTHDAGLFNRVIAREIVHHPFPSDLLDATVELAEREIKNEYCLRR
ncbi:hypothetical protein PtA15_6A391 [Puccinia triticina]|uniref:Uncharacterized protein n=1 Tax=Puccinia triticina TaxID=208348 RepID=A0ABY7CMP6_9BASI|nr:uncharacterized protein PtA15_6A391 [Puccinia triticina]WAQ85762.1 hypothetical protein PtA15_6A391 [Puccinia triticina]